MGTEVESKMYLPEYNSLRDVNDIARNGGWALNYENRNLKSDQYGGAFSFRPLTDEYVGYYKEQVRRTILKQESIFRHQVCELHRLYNIQRDMMNEVKRKDLDKYQPSAGSSQKPGLIPFGFLSESDRKRWQTPNLPCDRPSASGGIGSQSHFDSLKETMVSSHGPDRIGLRLGDPESLQPKLNTLQKRFFDLELPENDFVNNEEVGQGICAASGTKNYPLSWNFDVTCEKDGNMPICSGLLSGSDFDALSSNVRLRSTHGLTDLNESFQLEDASGSASVNILGTATRSREDVRKQDLSVSYSGFQHLSNEFSPDPSKGKDEIIGHCNLHFEAEYKQKGLSAYNSETGRTRSNISFCLGNSSTLTQNEQDKAHEHQKFPFSEQNRTETNRKRKLFGVDISDGNNDAFVVTSQVLGPSPVVQFDATNSESSQVPSWKNLPGCYNWNLITAQGNPNTNAFAQLSKNSKTLMPSPSAVGGKFRVDSSLGSVTDFRSEIYCQNDLCIGSHWDSKKACTCNPLVGFNDACGISDSNSASECHAKNNSEVLGSIMDANSAGAMYAGAVPPNVYQMNLDFLQSHSQLSNRTEMTKDPSQSFVQDALSATHSHDAERMRHEVGDLSSRKILGLPIYQKSMPQDLLSHNSPSKSGFVASATDGSNSFKVGLLDTDLNRDPVSSISQERPAVEGLMVEKEMVNHGVDLKHDIDLNMCASEDEGQLTPSCLGANVRIVGERDLVSPIIMENKSCVDHELESIESGIKETFNSSGDEFMEPLEGLVKVAADALVAISSSHMPYQGSPTPTFDQLEASPSDSLQWFAEIISSHKGDIGDEVSLSLFKDVSWTEDSVPNELDHFEFMTLNLSETKLEECTYNPQVLENSEHEEKPLPRRPRRGQARRGRQRKDFQRDVLPSLSILSRNDVNDDLQIIEGMVRAAGGTWQSSLSQRNTARSTSGRGRRRRGGATNSQTATAVSPSKTQLPKFGEPGLVEISLAGWGKRTRRLPLQRCPISNNPSNK